MSPWLQSSSARDWANYDWVFGHFTIDTLIIQETQQETGRKCQVVLRCGQDGKVGKVVSVENWIAPRERKRQSKGDGRDDEINEQREKRSTLEIEGRKTVECRLSAQERSSIQTGFRVQLGLHHPQQEMFQNDPNYFPFSSFQYISIFENEEIKSSFDSRPIQIQLKLYFSHYSVRIATLESIWTRPKVYRLDSDRNKSFLSRKKQ